MAVHEKLAAGGAVGVDELARELEVSPRTIKRDIERLRDSHAAPIVWDPAARGYCYDRPFDLLTGLRLDLGEALALVMAGRALASWSGSPLGQLLATALGKIADFAGEAASVAASEISGMLHDPALAEPAMEAEQRHFLGLVDSIRRSREVDLTYWKPGAPGPENRRVRPLHLAHLEHRWILVAEDPGQRAWRNFRVSRIQSFETTERRFQPPGRERIRAYLAGSLGRFTGAERHRVVLRIAKALVPYLKESPWHGTQRLEERPEGTAEVTLELNNLVDVRRRILACGAEVEVVAPEELRRAVASEARALARLYDQKDDLKAEKNDSRTEFVPPALID